MIAMMGLRGAVEIGQWSVVSGQWSVAKKGVDFFFELDC